MDDFALTISEHRWIAEGVPEVQAVLTVTAGTGGPVSGLAEVIVVDTSGSMADGPKMADARRATIAAVEALPAGAAFAVIAGDDQARMVFPQAEELAVAGPEAAAAARSAVRRLHPNGGTAAGAWLALARRLLAGRDGEIRHLTLLTDGWDDAPEELAATVAACRDVFQCDAFGIGEGWNARELIALAEGLRGRARAVTSQGDLAAEFRATVAAWSAKAVRDLTLRIELSPFATLRNLRQTHPVKAALTGHLRHPDGDGVVEVSTGAWAPGESREYQLAVHVGEHGKVHEEVRAGRIDPMVAGQRRGTTALVLVCRTADDRRSLPTDPKYRGYSEEAELSLAIGDGCAAYLKNEPERAAAGFGRAVRIAFRLGDETMLACLEKVVLLDDPAGGRVRLRPGLRAEDLLDLETWSQFSQEYRDDNPVPGPDLRCPCGWINLAGANWCEQCREPL